MPLMFNTLLKEAGLQLTDVRLLRHKDKRAAKGRTPYELWRDAPAQFDMYQSTQKVEDRARLKAEYWASFVGTNSGETLFVGIYRVNGRAVSKVDLPMPHRDGVDKAGTCDVYELSSEEPLSDLIGRLVIDWGPGKRSWIQRADGKEKPIVELRRRFEEPAFPGALEFTSRLSELDGLSVNWRSILMEYRGVYLLRCPKTGLQYVGKADGQDGFWGRWQDYVTTGDGGNVGLERHHKQHHKRDGRCDYQVSILEVAGTAATEAEIDRMERKWMAKLQTRERGLNE